LSYGLIERGGKAYEVALFLNEGIRKERLLIHSRSLNHSVNRLNQVQAMDFTDRERRERDALAAWLSPLAYCSIRGRRMHKAMELFTVQSGAGNAIVQPSSRGEGLRLILLQ